MRRLLTLALFYPLNPIAPLVILVMTGCTAMLFVFLVFRLLREEGPVKLKIGPLVFVKGVRARRQKKRRRRQAAQRR